MNSWQSDEIIYIGLVNDMQYFGNDVMKGFIYICSNFETIFDEYGRQDIFMKLLLDHYTEQ